MASDGDLSTALLIEEAGSATIRLRAAWPWLAEALIPGTVTVVERSIDLRDVERDRLEHRKDKLAAFASTKAGIVPSGPHPSGMKIGPASARLDICLDIRDTAEALWRSVHVGTALDLTVLLVDPTTRITRVRCERCTGVGWLPRPEGADKHDPPPGCPMCKGRGDMWAGSACVVCRAVAPCHCDVADAIMAIGLRVILKLLPKVTDADVATEAHRVLERADTRARNTAGVGDDKRIIKAPCPACGRRGDLNAFISARHEDGTPDVSQWKILCEHPSCVCTGPGCGCGRAVRYYGRKHVWPASEWDGPNGLAKRLGCALPGTERRADPAVPPSEAMAA